MPKQSAFSIFAQSAASGTGGLLIAIGLAGCPFANGHHDFQSDNAIGQTANELANINASIWPAVLFLAGVVICSATAIIRAISAKGSNA